MTDRADLESRVFLAIARSMPTKQPAAVLAEIEKTHVLIPVRYSNSDPNQSVHRRLLEEALLETVSRLEQAIEGQIHRILHGEPIRQNAAKSDTSESTT